MTKTDPKNWQQALSDVVRNALIARTQERYDKLSFSDYSAGKGGIDRNGFYKAWTSSVDEMFYRLRSAKTRSLFSAAFTQTLCRNPQWGFREFYDDIYRLLLDENRWQDLRDVLMLALSARSYIKPVTQEENSNESLS